MIKRIHTSITKSKKRERPGKKVTMTSQAKSALTKSEQDLDTLRSLLFQLDTQVLEILATRGEVSKRIGKIKLDENIPVLQLDLWKKNLKKLLLTGSKLGLDSRFVSQLFKLIHENSVTQQFEIAGNAESAERIELGNIGKLPKTNKNRKLREPLKSTTPKRKDKT